MTQEREGEPGVVADATEPFVDDLLGLSDGIGTEIGELAVLQIAPYLFDRVQVGGVGPQSLDLQPSSLLLEEGRHGSAMGVRRRSR